MKITLNGEEQELQDDILLGQLLEQMQLAGKRLAVEIDGEIIPKSNHAHFKIENGNRIEIVHAIGGG
ncbi:MAG: sulfur carrier protein ThiS [Gammaproteobacteria bacterium]|nr:sulfur carrier protein ThiS [Gammaproteobacteria bacterium]